MPDLHHIPSPEHPEHLSQFLTATPARLGVWRAGGRPLTKVWLKFRLDHAMARDAVMSELSEDFLRTLTAERAAPVIKSLADDRRDFVLNPPRGKRTDALTLDRLSRDCEHGRDVQIVVSDGLSARAVEANVPDLLPMLEQGLALEGITFGTPVVVRFGRVAIADQIAHTLGARLVINLIGERPGLSSACGLSAYLTFNPGPASISSDRTVVSNIQVDGTPAPEAGAYIVQLSRRILEAGVSGVKLQQLS